MTNKINHHRRSRREFWFEPGESLVVIRYPPAEEPEKLVVKSHHKHGHGHSG